MAADLETWNPIATVYDPLKVGSIDGTDKYPHDRAIIRAMKAKYKPNKQVQGDPHCTIFVGRLEPSTTEDTLREIFGAFGSIRNIRLVRDLITGFSKRYAFIEYKSSAAAELAATEGDQRLVDDAIVFVDMELERELKGWVPRRLGGGFGGKKESGQLRFGGKNRPWRKPIDLSKPHGRYEKTNQRINKRNEDTRNNLPNRRQSSSFRGNDRGSFRQNERPNRTSSSRIHDRRRSRSRDTRRNNRRSRSPTGDYSSMRRDRLKGSDRRSRSPSNSYSRHNYQSASTDKIGRHSRWESQSTIEGERRKRHRSGSADSEQKFKNKRERSRTPHKHKDSVVEEQAFGRWLSGSEDGEIESSSREPEMNKPGLNRMKKSRFHNYDSDGN